MSIILDTRTQNTMKSVQYNGCQDPGGYNEKHNDSFQLFLESFWYSGSIAVVETGWCNQDIGLRIVNCFKYDIDNN